MSDTSLFEAAEVTQPMHNQTGAVESGSSSTRPDSTEDFFSRLSDEILLSIILAVPFNLENKRIFSWKSPRQLDPGGLWSLSLVNRRLNYLVNGVLYKHCKMDKGGTPKFVRTIVTEPRIAVLVRRLDWDCSPISPMDDAGVRNALLKIGTPYAHQLAYFSADLENPNQYQAFVAAVLMHIPNIEQLDLLDFSITHSAAERIPYLDPIRNGVLHPFQNLRTLRLAKYHANIRDIIPLMYLPSLRKLKLHGTMGPPSEELLPAHLHLGSSNIEELCLEDCCIESGILSNMISTCQKLISLKYNHNEDILADISPWNGSCYFEFEDLCPALEQHKNSLQELYLTSVESPWQREFNGLLGDFSEFPKLIRMGVPFIALSDRPDGSKKDLLQILPPGIQLLVLDMKNCENLSDQCHMNLETLANSRNKFPDLGCVQISGGQWKHRDDAPEWPVLEKMFKASGIKFSVDMDSLEFTARDHGDEEMLDNPDDGSETDDDEMNDE